MIRFPDQWMLAQQLARSLFEDGTDPNELNAVASYSRNHTGVEIAQLVKVRSDPASPARSRQTSRYYKNMTAAFAVHIREYLASDHVDRGLAVVLGQTARLMRYYDTDDGNDEFIRSQNEANERKPAPKPQPGFQPLAARESERWAKEKVTLCDVPKDGRAKVTTMNGTMIACANVSAYPAPAAGSVCVAEVLYRGETPVRAVFKGMSK